MFLGVGPDPYCCDMVTGMAGHQKLSGNLVVGLLHVNCARYHTLFINSDLGTHNDSLGPTGSSTIARKVTIDQPSGSYINDMHALPFDYVTLEAQSINSIRFRLADWKGKSVSMPAAWSLSVVIVPEEQF